VVPGVLQESHAISTEHLFPAPTENLVQPGNLFAFGAQYFAEKQGQTAGELAAGPKVSRPSALQDGAYERASAVGTDDYKKLSEAVYGTRVREHQRIALSQVHARLAHWLNALQAPRLTQASIPDILPCMQVFSRKQTRMGMAL
jgi:hypothetical protein